MRYTVTPWEKVKTFFGKAIIEVEERFDVDEVEEGLDGLLIAKIEESDELLFAEVEESNVAEVEESNVVKVEESNISEVEESGFPNLSIVFFKCSIISPKLSIAIGKVGALDKFEALIFY